MWVSIFRRVDTFGKRLHVVSSPWGIFDKEKLYLSNFSYRGKGDYYRLGHGTEEHVRRPKKVAGLQGKKIVSIATGKKKSHSVVSGFFSCNFIEFFRRFAPCRRVYQ